MTLKRYYEPGQYYFLTNVTAGRKPLFKDQEHANFLLANIEYFKYCLNYDVFGYVVMPDHFHLLLRPSDKFNCSKIMNFIKGNFSRKYNEREGVKGRNIWQKRFYDEVVRTEKDMLNQLQYMHNNPVKDGLVSSPGEYDFSSYHQYMGHARKSVQVKISEVVF